MVRVFKQSVGGRSEGLRQRLQDGATPPLNLVGPLGQAGEELAHGFLHGRLGPQATVGGHLFPHPPQMGSSALKSGL
jgi:hypothetical protein